MITILALRTGVQTAKGLDHSTHPIPRFVGKTTTTFCHENLHPNFHQIKLRNLEKPFRLNVFVGDGN